jgi:LacI family transcriptional regulator
LRGIGRFARQRTDWHVYPMDSDDPRCLEQLRDGPIDGVIAPAIHGMGRLIPEGSAVPQVYLNLRPPPRDAVVVCHDDWGIGRVAAEHLLSRGIRSFAYVGRLPMPRGESFMGFVRAMRLPCAHLEMQPVRGPSAYGQHMDQLMPFLRDLPLPAGVMAFSDPIGAEVIEAAARVGLDVPDDIAVIGCDDDEVLCECSSPPLTSVDPDFERVGETAALWLSKLMAGEAPPREPITVPPRGVIERASTDVLAYADDDVRRAVRFIRDSAAESIGVADILKAVPVSRRALEQRFRKHVGRTLQEEIWRTHTERALRLLRETDWPLMDVAVSSGFSSLAHLSRTIRRAAGVTPTLYRRRHRTGAPQAADPLVPA